jgi:hypothetical protein
MKIEFGLSVLSKRETLLGLQITTHNGVTAETDGLYSERVVELSIGIVFAILTLGFVSTGEKLDMPEMDNVKRAIEAFENEIKQNEK